jgi:hypothetical protein
LATPRNAEAIHEALGITLAVSRGAACQILGPKDKETAVYRADEYVSAVDGDPADAIGRKERFDGAEELESEIGINSDTLNDGSVPGSEDVEVPPGVSRVDGVAHGIERTSGNHGNQIALGVSDGRLPDRRSGAQVIGGGWETTEVHDVVVGSERCAGGWNFCASRVSVRQTNREQVPSPPRCPGRRQHDVASDQRWADMIFCLAGQPRSPQASAIHNVNRVELFVRVGRPSPELRPNEEAVTRERESCLGGELFQGATPQKRTIAQPKGEEIVSVFPDGGRIGPGSIRQRSDCGADGAFVPAPRNTPFPAFRERREVEAEQRAFFAAEIVPAENDRVAHHGHTRTELSQGDIPEVGRHRRASQATAAGLVVDSQLVADGNDLPAVNRKIPDVAAAYAPDEAMLVEPAGSRHDGNDKSPADASDSRADRPNG